uniref:VWFA domain-containing protein n=1 Tax=Romanomermis culicivorax TaxID=13658 RepID=A0A915IWL3_ROMCU
AYSTISNQSLLNIKVDKLVLNSILLAGTLIQIPGQVILIFGLIYSLPLFIVQFSLWFDLINCEAQFISNLALRKIMISVALALMLLSQALVYGAAKTDCEKVSYKKLDLLFILDGSASVEAVNFVKTLNFVKNVVARLPIGAQETAVGVIQFTLLGANNNDVEGFKPRNEITLNSIQNRDQLIKKIGEIKYIEGCTLTNQAIWEGFKQFTIHGRKQVPKVMVVITDGKSSEKIDEAANNAHRAGITIISVGVGRAVDRSQLLKMAHNDTNRVFSIAKFNELVNFVDQLAMTIQKTIDPSCYSAPKVTLTPKPKGPFKHGQKVELECSIETVFTDIEYIFLKDEEVIPINLQKSTFRGGIKVRYSFTISTTTVGVYQCRTKTSWGLVSLSQKVEVLKKVNPDEGKPDAGRKWKSCDEFTSEQIFKQNHCTYR